MLVIQNFSVNGFLGNSLRVVCVSVCVSYTREWLLLKNIVSETGSFPFHFYQKYIFFLVNCKMAFGFWSCDMQNVNELVPLCSGFWVGDFGLVLHSCKPNLVDKARKESLAHKKIEEEKKRSEINFVLFVIGISLNSEWNKDVNIKWKSACIQIFWNFERRIYCYGFMTFFPLFRSVDENIRILLIHFIMENKSSFNAICFWFGFLDESAVLFTEKTFRGKLWGIQLKFKT